ncbi:TadE/TadG family type IV pilus assembly protein [Paenibacillus chitinolyticus]
MRMFRKSEQGGMVLEAALILPMFVGFIVALIVCIQIAVADMALRSAVSESTKVLAAGLYPAEVLYKQGKVSFDQTALASEGQQVMDTLQNLREQAAQAGEFIDSVEAYLPDPVVGLLSWVRQTGESGVDGAKEAASSALHDAMKPVVYSFADKRILKKDRFRISGVTLPSLTNRERTYLGFEVTYDFPLAVPFFNRMLVLKKKALERVWLGA